MSKGVKITLAALVAVTLAIFGGVKLKEMNEHNEMVKIVRSKGAREAVERTLHNLDPNAFTDKGIIKTYEIDEKSLTHNPMGGINMDVYLNGKKEFAIGMILDKVNNKFKIGSSIVSPELVDILPKYQN